MMTPRGLNLHTFGHYLRTCMDRTQSDFIDFVGLFTQPQVLESWGGACARTFIWTRAQTRCTLIRLTFF